MITKVFGSIEFFNELRSRVAAGDNDFLWTDVHDVIVADYKGLLIASGIPEYDRSIVVDKCVLAVKKQMPKFLRESVNKTAAQRNCWLKRIIKGKIVDYYREKAAFMKKSFGDEYLTVEDIPSLDSRLEKISNMTENYNKYAEIYNLISFVCDIKTSPDKIIAFFFNKVILYLRSNHYNGYPSKIAEVFSGKPLGELAGLMKVELMLELGFKIPAECFRGLDEKLNRISNDGRILYSCEFRLTSREITDSSYRILQKTRDAKNLIIGGAAK